MDKTESTYIGITVKGCKGIIWFKTKETTFESGNFVGQNGWGPGKATIIEAEIDSKDIMSRIYSDNIF